MIPIGDDRLQNARKPLINILLIIINVVVFWQEITMDPQSLDAFINRFAAIPARIENGQNLISLFTSMFLHGGWMHLIGNMLFLWIFGDNIEAALGHIGYLIFYILGGLAGAIAHVITNLGDMTPSLGASGAISACMGAYIMMFPTSRIRTFVPLGFFFTTMRVSAWVFIGVWIVFQIFSSTAGQYQETEGGGVAWWAHIGGFAFGLLVGLLFRGRAKNLVVIRDEDVQRRRWF
jgi:membrane associated rhomboid family serine protease